MDVRLPDGSGHRGLPRDPRRAAGDAGRDAHVATPTRRPCCQRDRRRRLGLPAQAGPGARPRGGARDRRRAASRCWTRRSPRRSSSASAGSPPAATRTRWPPSRAQEQKILLLVAEGKTNKEIAADVFLSDKTVKNYVSSILSKLNLERRAQAAAFVAKHRRRPRRRLTRWGEMEDDLVAWGRVVRIEATGRRSGRVRPVVGGVRRAARGRHRRGRRLAGRRLGPATCSPSRAAGCTIGEASWDAVARPLDGRGARRGGP